MKEELATRYEPSDFEQRIYAFWEKGGYFTPCLDRERPKFSIVIPPPNVTGRLHIGHALVNTLQDIIVRWSGKAPRASSWDARSSSSASGNGRSSTPPRSKTSSRASAPRPIGRASASRSTKVSPAPCATSS
jgi:hypothetical protein